MPREISRASDRQQRGQMHEVLLSLSEAQWNIGHGPHDAGIVSLPHHNDYRKAAYRELTSGTDSVAALVNPSRIRLRGDPSLSFQASQPFTLAP